MSPTETKDKKLTIDDCRQVAARIWCDWQFKHLVMDVKICEEIAQKLFCVANSYSEETISLMS